MTEQPRYIVASRSEPSDLFEPILTGDWNGFVPDEERDKSLGDTPGFRVFWRKAG